MKKILVTGGAGFIGSHLCDRLYNEGHFVISVDNYCTGSKENLAHLAAQEFNFRDLRRDVIKTTYVYGYEFDEIYNLACPASPKAYQADPLFTIQTCTTGLMNTMLVAMNKGKKSRAKVVHASTSEVYGDPLEHPQKESYYGNVNPVGPRSCYDEGKRIAETICMEYRKKYNLDIKIARIFNTYGPKMRTGDGRVVSNFIVRALQGKPLTVYGDGTQTRSFCYVDDMVDALIKLMAAPKDFMGPVNVGNPIECSINTLAGHVMSLTQEVGIVNKTLPYDDPKTRRPDITRAKEKLGWEPSITLMDGLQRTVDYFKGIIGDEAFK